jgi:hypothetical protein
MFKCLGHRGLWIKGLGLKCLKVNGLGLRRFRIFVFKDY